MVIENDTLRKDNQSLNRSLKNSQSAIMDLSTNFSQPLFDNINNELSHVTEELEITRQQRDEIVKENLILKQINSFYKHKNEIEDKVMLDKLFSQEQLLLKKDNIIKSQQNQIVELQKTNEERGVKVVEKYILEPTEWNMKFQNQSKLIEQKNQDLLKKISLLNKQLEKDQLMLKQLQNEVTQNEKIISVLRHQIDRLKQEITQSFQKSSIEGHQSYLQQTKKIEEQTQNQIQTIVNQYEMERSQNKKQMELIQSQINKPDIIMQDSINKSSIIFNENDLTQKQIASKGISINAVLQQFDSVKMNSQHSYEDQQQAKNIAALDFALSSINSNSNERMNIIVQEQIIVQKESVREEDKLFSSLKNNSTKKESLNMHSNKYQDTNLEESAVDFQIDEELFQKSQNHDKLKAKVPQLDFFKLPNYIPANKQQNQKHETEEIKIEQTEQSGANKQVKTQSSIVKQSKQSSKKTKSNISQSLIKETSKIQETTQSINQSKVGGLNGAGLFDAPDSDNSQDSETNRKDDKLRELLQIKLTSQQSEQNFLQTEQSIIQKQPLTIQNLPNNVIFEEIQVIGQQEMQVISSKSESQKSSKSERPKVITINGRNFVQLGGDSESEESNRKIPSPVVIQARPLSNQNNQNKTKFIEEVFEEIVEEEEEEIESGDEEQRQPDIQKQQIQAQIKKQSLKNTQEDVEIIVEEDMESEIESIKPQATQLQETFVQSKPVDILGKSLATYIKQKSGQESKTAVRNFDQNMETEIVIEEEAEEEMSDDRFRYDNSSMNQTQKPPQTVNLNKSFVEKQNNQSRNDIITSQQVKPQTQKYEPNPFISSQQIADEEEEVIVVEEEQEEEPDDEFQDNTIILKQEITPIIKPQVKQAFTSNRNSANRQSNVGKRAQQVFQNLLYMPDEQIVVEEEEEEETDKEDLSQLQKLKSSVKIQGLFSETSFSMSQTQKLQQSEQKQLKTDEEEDQEKRTEVIVEEEEEEEIDENENLKLTVNNLNQQTLKSNQLRQTQTIMQGFMIEEPQRKQSEETEIVIEEEEEEEVDSDHENNKHYHSTISNNTNANHLQSRSINQPRDVKQDTLNFKDLNLRQNKQQETEIVIEEEDEEEIESMQDLEEDKKQNKQEQIKNNVIIIQDKQIRTLSSQKQDDQNLEDDVEYIIEEGEEEDDQDDNN
ncbi:UNKNOWN [Stylonychia lemnae]|uniref:Uncharacterized protein n=1 Tax=Stylonychia lemnae TaxID=5949 RepID=A0A078BDZ4_STYLE|nr:UNKNOWN [Stylonychia lemnae]|eukprot:CDW91803.1 UNKNOWN [Stylonychia lemnae]